MKLQLTMDCDNAYFGNEGGMGDLLLMHERVATMLHGVADKIENGHRRVVIVDGNGNNVGVAEIVEG